jgi:ABC-2 type transport system permease protein
MIALRVGLVRGVVGLRQSFAGAGLLGHLLWPAVTLAAVWWLRGDGIRGLSLGTLILPGALGMFVAFGALLVIQTLSADRADGTLLRARVLPHGTAGYLVGTFVTVSATVLVYLAILLIGGVLLVDGLTFGWWTFGWVLALGMLAAQSVGALLGAVITGPRGAGYVSVLVLALVSVSGIFYPVTALPQWAQWIAQAFPMYWLGLGMRAAFLPEAATTVEIGQSWRPVATAVALGGWALAGLLVAPVVLRRTTRRESGSRVAERQEKALRAR